MLRKTLLLVIALLAAIIGVVIISAQFFSSPAKFVVKNLDSDPVRVTAHWRDKTKNIGQIPSNTATEFFVEDETTMTFEITRSNGTAVAVGNINFSPNTSTSVEITHTSVEVNTDKE